MKDIFRIKTILGEYYISIYKFPTLSSIIGYFSQVSPLLAGLYLKSPLSPKRVCFLAINFRGFFSLHEFTLCLLWACLLYLRLFPLSKFSY